MTLPDERHLDAAFEAAFEAADDAARAIAELMTMEEDAIDDPGDYCRRRGESRDAMTRNGMRQSDFE